MNDVFRNSFSSTLNLNQRDANTNRYPNRNRQRQESELELEIAIDHEVEEDSIEVIGLKSKFKEIMIGYLCCILVNYVALIVSTAVYSTVSVTNFTMCLLFSFGICALDGETFSNINRRINVCVVLVLYALCFVSFIDQGVCNVWQKGCVYLNRDLPNHASEAETHKFLQDNVNLGLLLLTSLGTSFVFLGFIVMKSLQILHTKIEERVPSSPLKRTPKRLSSVTNKFGLSECLICHIAFEPTSKVHILSCKHIFHGDCFRSWFKKNRSCPICRIPVENRDDFSPKAKRRAIDF